MTLDELNQININDPAQIKALQTFLKSRGYYNGGIDGKWGGGTIDGVKSLRTDLQTEAQTALRTKEVGLKAAETNLQAEQEKSSWGRFTQEFGPWGAGGAGGLLAGYGLMRKNAAADKQLGKEVGEMVTDKRVTPVIAEKTMDTRLRGRTLRAGRQMLIPATAFGGAEVTRRYIKPNVSEEIQPYIDLAASTEQGLGGGLAIMTIEDALSSKNPVPANTEALIRSRAAEARGDPYTISGKEKASAPAAPDAERLAELRAKRAADLRTEAKAMGLHVSGTKEDLARRIAEAPAQAPAKKGRLPRGKAGLLAPFAAGALAYDAATESAEAAGDAPAEARGKGVLAGAGAAGLTASIPYAISKLPESIGRAAGAAGPAFAGSTIDAMTDYPPEEVQKFDLAAKRYLPERMVPRVSEERLAMAQVPSRNPARPRAGMFEEGGGQDFDAMLADFVRAIEEHNAGAGGN